ncbi:MAG: putative 60 kDa inner rane insertion protein [Candidatus Saccharibacteria bacterium]|nr:putative 60 kDa inner rane insertion protein [Candidatus Saccharibacteria bacterium]
MNIFELLIVQPIFNLLIALYSIIPGSDFGVSVILFTILVRFALYPLLKRQLHQTKLMRKLQPELKRIKKSTKGNRQLESVQMLELYKKHGVSPFRSILILLIQLPIFLALYNVIQIFTLHRDQIAKFTYDFLEGVPAISHLIKHPEQFNEKLLGIVDLTKPAIGSHGVDIILLVLAVVAAGTQYIMSKQTMPHTDSKKRLRDIMSEAAAGKQADQSDMNAAVMGKMMKFLPVFMFFIMISIPGAIALYYGVSNIVAVLQQSYLLRQDSEEMDEIADEVKAPVAKKATTKAREKAAKEATVTRITAKPSAKRKK